MTRSPIRIGTSRTRAIRTVARSDEAPTTPPEPTKSSWSRDWRRWAVVAGSDLGVAFSGFLTWIRASGAEAPAIGGGTAAVETAADLFGLPIAAYSLGLYLALATLSLLWVRPSLAFARDAGLAIFGLSLVGVGVAAYLTWLNLAFVLASCALCLVTAMLLVGICVGSGWAIRQSRRA